MLHTKTDRIMVAKDGGMLLDTGNDRPVRAVAFSLDGKYLFCGVSDGIRRFRLADKVKTAERTGIGGVYAISISRNDQRIVCGAEDGASVWDAELEEKIYEVEEGKEADGS